jgi:O-antigen/teichoic acid export membrane protein
MISGFDLVVQNIDVLMISLYMTPREVGIYFAGLKTMSLIAFVHYAVASASAHHFAALRERGDHKGLARLIQDTVTWTFWPSLVGAVLILALGRPLLALFGPEFESAHLPMAVLAVGLLIKASAGSAEFILNALGEQKRCGAVLLATALLDVGLNVLLVSRFGLMGAAFATATTLAVTAFLYRWLIWRTLGLKLSVRGVRM